MLEAPRSINIDQSFPNGSNRTSFHHNDYERIQTLGGGGVKNALWLEGTRVCGRLNSWDIKEFVFILRDYKLMSQTNIYKPTAVITTTSKLAKRAGGLIHLCKYFKRFEVLFISEM